MSKTAIRVYFYKADGDWMDKAIRWWTKSSYSHTEIQIDGFMYSSSPRDGMVRKSDFFPDRFHWDYVELKINIKQKKSLKQFFVSQLGKKYDYLGIALSQIIPLEVQDPNRWFCSEICSKALDYAKIIKLSKPPQWYSPKRLYSYLK